jgi:hypothetical protein
VKLRVHVDGPSRSTIRALASLVYWARRRSMWRTPSVALTAQHGVRARFTGHMAIVTGVYCVDVTVALHCSGRLAVDVAVSVQRAAAAGGSVFSLSWRRLRATLLLIYQRLLFVTVTVDVSDSEARGCACTVLSWGWWSMGVDAAVSVQSAADDADCVSSFSWCCVRAAVLLLYRRVALDDPSVDVRLSAGRGCVSLVADRAVMRLVVSGRRCGCVSPVYSCRARRRSRVIVLLVSRRLSLVTAAVNVCLSVGR